MGMSVRQHGDVLTVGNGVVELGFDAANHGNLTSIRDLRTGHQFVREPEARAALFLLSLRGQDGGLVTLNNTRASRFDWEMVRSQERETLVLRSSGFPLGEITVTISLSLEEGSGTSVWRAQVWNATDRTVAAIAYPLVTGLFTPGRPAEGEAIVYPWFGEGCVFRDPFPVVDNLPLKTGNGPDRPAVGLGELHLTYPGAASMQFMAYYNTTAGLYLATHDDGEQVKRFDVGPLPGLPTRQEGTSDGSGALQGTGGEPALFITHLVPERPGAGVEIPYETRLTVFLGDWYDAADLYKDWARRQWWCRRKLIERDPPRWLRDGVGVFQISNYHCPDLTMNTKLEEICDLSERLSRDIGVPLLVLIWNWEHDGAWTGPLGYFPPREGEQTFRDAMARICGAGNVGFVYVTGGIWRLEITHAGYSSWEQFEKTGRRSAVLDPSGKPRITGAGWEGWKATAMCPGTEYWRDRVVEHTLRCVSLGAPMVQVDEFPLIGAQACFATDHEHDPGYGPWWARASGQMLKEIRDRARAMDASFAMSTESVSESFIPWLELYDQRASTAEWFGRWPRGAPGGVEVIPLFGYVYHPYIAAYHAAFAELTRPETGYWIRAMGTSLAQGMIPNAGRYFPHPKDLNPVLLAFYTKVVRAAARELLPYLLSGEMLRPPRIEVPRIRVSYLGWTRDADHLNPLDRHEVEDAAVKHSVWRLPDGKVGLVFVNIADAAVRFSCELPQQEGRYRCEHVRDGRRSTVASSVSLPRVEQVELEPRSVLLVELCPLDKEH